MTNTASVYEKPAKLAEEAREIRRKTANWEFINSLPSKLRLALVYYIDTGDFRETARIAGMAVDEFLYFAKEKANVYDVS